MDALGVLPDDRVANVGELSVLKDDKVVLVGQGAQPEGIVMGLVKV